MPRPEPMPYNPITVDEWRSALKKKSRKSAIGPDGISKNDLLNLPYAATERLLQLFYMVEQGAKWPEQLMVGFVVALEKVRGATTTGQFRPITVFPFATGFGDRLEQNKSCFTSNNLPQALVQAICQVATQAMCGTQSCGK